MMSWLCQDNASTILLLFFHTWMTNGKALMIESMRNTKKRLKKF